jgi:hypothetical protein
VSNGPAATACIPGDFEALRVEKALALAIIDLVAAYLHLQDIAPGELPARARSPFELVCSGMCVTLGAIDLLGAIMWEGEADASDCTGDAL